MKKTLRTLIWPETYSQGFKESRSALGRDAICDCRRLGCMSLTLETVDYYSLPATIVTQVAAHTDRVVPVSYFDLSHGR